MKFDDQTFRLAAGKGHLGQLKAIYILNPKVLHATGITSGKNALDFAVEYEQRDVVQWLMSVGATPTDPTTLGSLILFMTKVKLTSDPVEDKLSIDDLNVLKKRAFEGLDYLNEKYGKEIDAIVEDRTFNEVVRYVKSAWEDVYIHKNETSLDSLYVFVNILEDQIQQKIKKIEQPKKQELSKEVECALAWVGLLSAVAILDFIRLYPKYPVFEKALSVQTVPKACSLIQLVLSDYEEYAISNATDADVVNLEHVSIQAHQAHAVAKASCRPGIIYPSEAKEHINRLNQQYGQRNNAFHARVVAAKDYEGTRQSSESVLNELVLTALQIKNGELPRTQFIVYVGKNSHSMTIDLSWNQTKQRFEVISFDMIEAATQQPQFLNNLKSELNKQNCDVLIATCNTKLQKDFESCVLYAIKLAKISSELTFAHCLAMKDPKTPFGKIIWFNVHRLGEKVIRMSQSVNDMRANLLKIYPNDPQKVQSLVEKYDVSKHLASMRRKTEMWKEMQGVEQKMGDLNITLQSTPLNADSTDTPEMTDLAARLKRVKRHFYNHSPADLQSLVKVIDDWQVNAKKVPDQFEYHRSVVRYTLAFAPDQALVYNGKHIVKIKFIQSGTSGNRKEFIPFSNRLIVKFTDNSNQTYDLTGANEQDEQVNSKNQKIRAQTRTLIMRLGGLLEDDLFNVSNRRIASWKRHTFEAMYSSCRSLERFYAHAHVNVAKRISRLVNGKDPVPKEVTLFSFGCGDAKELPLVQQKLTDAGIIVKGFGFDINPESFKKTAANHKELTFAVGDVLDLEQSISQQKFNPHSFKIGMFIGVLTDTVLKGTFDALKVIQQTRDLHYLFVEGWQSLLLSEKKLKAVGFNVAVTWATDEMMVAHRQINPDSKNLHGYELSWMSDEERRAYLQRKSMARSRENKLDMLDLEYSANPLRDLMLFDNATLKNIKTLDISWSYFKDNEVDAFFKLLAKIQAPKLIILVSSAQNAYTDIMKAASKMKHVFVHERNDAANENEIPAFMPTEAKRWGIYDQLPNIPLKRLRN